MLFFSVDSQKEALWGRWEREGLTELLSLVQTCRKVTNEQVIVKEKNTNFLRQHEPMNEWKVEKLPISQIFAKWEFPAIWIFCLIDLNQIWITHLKKKEAINNIWFLLNKIWSLFSYLIEHWDLTMFLCDLFLYLTHLLRTYCVPGTGERAVNKTDKTPALVDFTFQC